MPKQKQRRPEAAEARLIRFIVNCRRSGYIINQTIAKELTANKVDFI